jgi:hypothetical protein
MCLPQNYFNITFISLVVHYHVNITMSTPTTIVVSTHKPNGKEILWMVHHTQTYYLICNFFCVIQVFFCTCSCCFFCWVLDLDFYLFIDELRFESPKVIWKLIQKRLYTQTQNISNPIHTWIDSKQFITLT